MYKKTLFSALLLMCCQPIVMACDACKKKQAVVLGGLTHGKTPDSNWDYLIVVVMVVVVLVIFFYSVKWLIRPGEKSAGHIKQFILE
ncbi:hypothetical protein [Chitinophaga pinensis]|uniref:CcmD family protein n=1 Tax=Chitinophaga pinensis (strain ATCC 43595 / DSM 2588 / LMG 13176 / NBRC 15968 / NCIMB 11800 / UQM 2034) TaxID=485918 RepID=A0A979GYK6_CHIPD|nr:hypothetical protein [Chitinophaga pinensis]ACU63201.1 hypothetical protein Cpin_5781 [Chitinophaga pinensis DSM 2588]